MIGNENCGHAIIAGSSTMSGQILCLVVYEEGIDVFLISTWRLQKLTLNFESVAECPSFF